MCLSHLANNYMAEILDIVETCILRLQQAFLIDYIDCKPSVHSQSLTQGLAYVKQQIFVERMEEYIHK